MWYKNRHQRFLQTHAYIFIQKKVSHSVITILEHQPHFSYPWSQVDEDRANPKEQKTRNKRKYRSTIKRKLE